MEKDKREVPSTLRKILAVELYLTDRFIKELERILLFQQFQVHYKALEISCHGISWLVTWTAFIWILNSKHLYQMQVNFLLALLLDIVIIAVIKSIARRRRPTINTDPCGIGPDKYSFPSGHASRAAFIVYFFLNIWPIHITLVPGLLAWSTSVCFSRVLLRKHYLLDVGVGVILGIALGKFMNFIYLNEDTCTNFIYWITSEKLDGGEYHV